jgi:hypothetical protein
VDEREIVDHVAKRPERDCLDLLKGRAMACALFLAVFLIDAALPETTDDLVDVVSANLAIVKNSDNLLLLILSYL